MIEKKHVWEDTFIDLQSFISHVWKYLDLIHYWLNIHPINKFVMFLTTFLRYINFIKLFSES